MRERVLKKRGGGVERKSLRERERESERKKASEKY